MFDRVKTVMAASALGIMVMATAALAGPADDAIKARQACMKAHGGVMAVAVPVMKGEKPFDAAALKAASDKEDAACAGWDTFWGADTQQGEAAETWAKPEIWSDNAGFQAAGGAWWEAAQKLRAATDEASFKATFPAVGKACQDCHEKFRRPKG
jgi:cytochrome c556